ncbi:MAG TPA: zinc-ribbon domain-containing protein [Candidatus Paceibacterota bacterium]|nr:zinc-ribbon domain-containing protein [Candidatus Paceibacterota bacterium]
MFCENCGNKIQDGYKFCTKCGASAVSGSQKNTTTSQTPEQNEKWWHRLLKVMYILAYIPLPLVLIVVWSASSSSYDYSTSSTTDTSGTAFWYCVLATLIYLVVVRLIKIAVLYIAVGRKPEWKKEFKRLF